MAQPNPIGLFELFNEIGIINQLARARMEARLPDGLITPHFSVLNHLIRVGDGTTPQRMASAFQVPKTSMTHTLKGLVAHNLVDIRPNPEDGRSKTVWITEAGRTLRNDVIAALGADFGVLLQHLNVEKLLEIRPVLTELRIVMDENR